MLIVGLTGGIATGKSTVSDIFKHNGIAVIDSDLIARQVVQPGHSTYNNLRNEFGSDYFDDENGGILMREKLGKLIFQNAEKRRRLNAITHPSIRWEIFKLFIYHLFTGTGYIVFDTPLLYETGYDKILGNVIVVWCDSNIELSRLILRDGLSEEDAKSRIAAQMPIEEKKKKATILIDNNGTMEELKEQVNTIIAQLNSSWSPLIWRCAITSIIAGIVYFATSRIFH